MPEVVPVHLVKYDNPEEIETDENHTVTNHDELEKTNVIRGIEREAAEDYGMDIVTPESSLWDENVAHIQVGEEIKV